MKILNLYACLGGNRYKWDEATIFLSTYKDGLAQDFQKKEDKINHKKS